ncbi:MAG: hypothetical protein DMD61_09015 [Gemmatimonadetes bacterium]|nr:MAG: hypothetical protein DMD61_09015 [Gemmatimonadota bacterium]
MSRGRDWLATAVVVAAVAGGSAGCEQRARDVQNEAELKQAVEQMMPAVERAMGLRFRQHPVVLRRSRAQVRDYVIHKFDDDLPTRTRCSSRPTSIPARHGW